MLTHVKTRTTERWTRPQRFLVTLLAAGTVAAASCSSESEPEPGEPETTADAEARVHDLEANVEDLESRVAEKDAELAELREEKQRLEGRIPEPFAVTPGDSHWAIGFRYLTEERGVDPEKARRELERAALVDPIVEGFEIYNSYDGEHFGSFPVQGDARVSPGTLLRATAEKAEEERSRLASRVTELQSELRTERARLERRIAHLESRVAVELEANESLRTYIDSLRQYQAALQTRLARLEEHLSSVHYVVGTRSRLRAEGKVEQPFLNIGGARLGDVVSEDFNRRMDLRETSSIELHAEELGIASIEDLDLLPSRWEENTDYRVSIAADGQRATLQLVDANRFRLETIVILVSS